MQHVFLKEKGIIYFYIPRWLLQYLEGRQNWIRHCPSNYPVWPFLIPSQNFYILCFQINVLQAFKTNTTLMSSPFWCLIFSTALKKKPGWIRSFWPLHLLPIDNCPRFRGRVNCLANWRLFKLMTTMTTWSLKLVWETVRFSQVPGAGLAEGGGLPVDQLAPELVHLLLHPLHLRVKPATGNFVITSIIFISISFFILKDTFPLQILQFCT